MKRILGFFFAASLPFMFASCQEETQEETKDTLEVTPSSVLEFSASGNDAVAVAVITDASSWDFSADEWILAEKTEDGLSVNVQDNDTGASRQGEIGISAGSAVPVKIQVTQRAESFIELSPAEINDNGDGAEYEVTVTTSGEDWTLVGGDTEEPDWCTVSAKEGVSGDVVTFTVAQNDSEAKEYTWTFTAGNASVGLKVTSTPRTRLEVTYPEGSAASVPVEGGSCIVRISCDLPIEEISCVIPEEVDWLTLGSTDTGLGGDYVYRFDVAANESYVEREAVVTFTAGNASAEVAVVQFQTDAVLTDTPRLEADGLDAQTLTLVVKANIDITMKMPDVDWLSLADEVVGEAGEDGLVPHTYTLSLTEASVTRSADIVFTRDGGTEVLRVTVVQRNPNPTYVSFADPGFADYLLRTGLIMAAEDAEGKYELTQAGYELEELRVEPSGFSMNVKTISGLGSFPALTSIYVDTDGVTSIDIMDCSNVMSVVLSKDVRYISYVNLGNNPVKSFSLNDLSPTDNLNYLSCENLSIIGMQLEVINASAYDNIGMMWNDTCEWLDVSLCPALKELHARRERTADGTGPKLRTIYMSAEQIAAVGISLTVDKCDGTQIVKM